MANAWAKEEKTSSCECEVTIWEIYRCSDSGKKRRERMDCPRIRRVALTTKSTYFNHGIGRRASIHSLTLDKVINDHKTSRRYLVGSHSHWKGFSQSLISLPCLSRMCINNSSCTISLRILIIDPADRLCGRGCRTASLSHMRSTFWALSPVTRMWVDAYSSSAGD